MAGRGQKATVESPNGRVEVGFDLEDRGEEAGYRSLEADCPVYSVRVGDHPVVEPSRLGPEFDGGPPLTNNVAVVDTEREEVNRNWSPTDRR